MNAHDALDYAIKEMKTSIEAKKKDLNSAKKMLWQLEEIKKVNPTGDSNE
jgi:molybdopterin synthase catalytic subunit